MTNTLVISDLHFGTNGALLTDGELIGEALALSESAETLVLAGDIFDFSRSTVEESLEAARPFLAEAGRRIKRLVVVPGNHDYLFQLAQTDEKQLLGGGGMGPGRLRLAEEAIARFVPSDVGVEVHYPFWNSGCLWVFHGHQIEPHLGSIGYRLSRWLFRTLTDSGEIQTAGDYERYARLTAGVAHQLAQAKGSRAIRSRGGSWRRTGLLPLGMLRRAGALLQPSLRDSLFARSTDPFVVRNHEESVKAMHRVAADFGVPPGSTVVFGHTHSPMPLTKFGDRSFVNTGSWWFDHTTAQKPGYREHLWPGTVVRADQGSVEVLNFLGGRSVEDLAAICASGLEAVSARGERLRDEST